jgi:hypothetical protein
LSGIVGDALAIIDIMLTIAAAVIRPEGIGGPAIARKPLRVGSIDESTKVVARHHGLSAGATNLSASDADRLPVEYPRARSLGDRLDISGMIADRNSTDRVARHAHHGLHLWTMLCLPIDF